MRKHQLWCAPGGEVVSDNLAQDGRCRSPRQAETQATPPRGGGRSATTVRREVDVIGRPCSSQIPQSAL